MSTHREGDKSRRSPPPPSHGKKIIFGVAFTPLRGGRTFFPFGVHFFSFLGGLVSLFGSHFLYVGGRSLFSAYVEKFLGFFPLTKFSAGTHGLAARVVANISSWGCFRYIVRRNLLIHFGAHFHIMLRKSKK